VTPDPDRRLLSRAEVVEEHFASTGLPRGHGFTEANRTDGTAYYAYDQGKHVRFVVLDTVNQTGYSDGNVDADQMTWLAQQLAKARKAGRYVIIGSHHTSTSMFDPTVGDQVVSMLLANPCVIAWVNGHSHRNKVTPHVREGGSGGFWEINTASHIDWPQQSRVIELADNRDGTLSIFTTIIDHAAPLGEPGTDSVLALASLSRELAANDWQEQTTTRSGAVEDRNCELLLPKPKLG
jgi:metallophosphoesterase (TIGR03767 family)